MIATIINNQQIQFSNITPWEEEILIKHLTVVDPNARYIDGYIPRILYNKQNKTVARPLLGEIRKLARDKDLALIIQDGRPPSKHQPIPISQITPDFLPGITLKDYQIEAIKKVYTTEVGVFGVAVSGGKGELIAGICKAIPCPTVIMAEQIIVIDQLRRRLQLRDVCEEPGLFYAGKMPNGQPIIIGSIQSITAPSKPPEKPERSKFKNTSSSTGDKKYQLALKRYESSLKGYKSRLKKAKALHDLISKCEMLIVDEVDCATSKSWRNLFRYWFKGRRRYGMTGTPYDELKPVEYMTMLSQVGSVIYKQSHDQIRQAGLAVPIEYNMIAYYGSEGYREDARTFDAAINDFLVNDEQFHLTIKDICDQHPDEGTLILVERDELGYALQALLGCEFFHGKTPKKIRPQILSAFERRESKVLIGGKNVRRGMDLRGGVENLIIATGGKLRSELDQRIGRARRLNDSGKARVYDFLFLCNKYLYAHSRNRLKAVVDMGAESRVVFRDGVVDGAQFVRSRFRKPKHIKR